MFVAVAVVIGEVAAAELDAGPKDYREVLRKLQPGDTLRLRGRGAKDRRSGQVGHQYVTLKVVLPKGEEPELARFLEGWTPAHERDPRQEMLR